MRSIEDLLTRPAGLATRLATLRAQSGLTGEQLARRLGTGWTESKISKIGRGKQLPTAEEVDAWARACGADATVVVELQGLLVEATSHHRENRIRMRLGQAPIQRDYDEMARKATSIRNAEVSFVPGLLQVQGYVRARMEENVRLYGADPNEVEAAVAARIRRQEVLYDNSKRFEFVLSEACLRLLICSADVMAAQLDRLLGLATGSLSHVTLGIIPFGIQLSVTPQSSFILFDDMAAVETLVGDTFHHGTEAATYAAAMDELMAEARTGEDARRLILAALEALRNE